MLQPVRDPLLLGGDALPDRGSGLHPERADGVVLVQPELRLEEEPFAGVVVFDWPAIDIPGDLGLDDVVRELPHLTVLDPLGPVVPADDFLGWHCLLNRPPQRGLADPATDDQVEVNAVRPIDLHDGQSHYATLLEALARLRPALPDLGGRLFGLEV